MVDDTTVKLAVFSILSGFVSVVSFAFKFYLLGFFAAFAFLVLFFLAERNQQELTWGVR